MFMSKQAIRVFWIIVAALVIISMFGFVLGPVL